MNSDGATSPARILVVEDEFLIRITLVEALIDEGFEVVEAGTAAEALALIHGAASFALMLTDVQLPNGMDGLTLARTARDHLPDLPVIFMTGRPDHSVSDAASGRDVIISKPYMLADVCAACRSLTAS